MTHSNICRKEYALTMNAMKTQLPSQKKVSLALVGWTSMNRLAVISLIAYYLNQNWALREVQFAFDEVNRQFFCAFES